MAMNISVYVTSYNQRDLLKVAVDSVLEQTLPASQIIIVDDCSTDGSQDLIAEYARRHPKRLTPIWHPSNTGVSQARIDALRAVTGEYVTYVDGDDRLLPRKLELEAAALESHPEADIVFSNNIRITGDGAFHSVWADGEKPPEGDVFAETFARAFPRHELFRTELVRYSAWKEVGFHDPSLPIFEDWEMRIRLTRRCRTVYVDEPLSEYRLHDAGLSRSRASLYLQVIDQIVRTNRGLLSELPKSRRRWVMKQLRMWVAGIQRRAAREAVDSGARWSALAHYLGALKSSPSAFNLGLAAEVVLPASICRRLRKHRGVSANGDSQKEESK